MTPDSADGLVEPPPWASADPVACLIATRDARLARLARALRDVGVDLEQGMRTEDPTDLARGLDEWTISTWGPIARREWAVVERWWNPASHVRGDTAQAYTRVVDTGIALGELVVRRRSGWAWGIDRYEAHRADGHESFGRLVVLRPDVSRDALYPVVFDAIDTAFMRLQSLAYGLPRRAFDEALRPCQSVPPFQLR